MKVSLKHLLDVTAVIVAIAALLHSINFNRASVERQVALEIEKSRPFLQLKFLKADSEPNKGIVVTNVGLGPAVISSFRYFLNEEAFQNGRALTSWIDDKGNLTFSDSNVFFDELNVLSPEFVISAGDNNRIFLQRESDGYFFHTQVRKDMESLIVEIEYRSLNSLDEKTYFVRYCERFVQNNIRNQTLANVYEN